MILGNFSYLSDMCKIFDKYHVWSWAPTSVRGPTVRGPNCTFFKGGQLGTGAQLWVAHYTLSYTDLWTISFSVLQRLDWSPIEIFHKAAQLPFFQPGQISLVHDFDVELNMPQCQFQYFQMPDFAAISALNFAMFPHSTVNLQNRLQWRNNLGITTYLFNLNFFATVGIKLLLFCMTIMAKSTNGVVNG